MYAACPLRRTYRCLRKQTHLKYLIVNTVYHKNLRCQIILSEFVQKDQKYFLHQKLFFRVELPF